MKAIYKKRRKNWDDDDGGGVMESWWLKNEWVAVSVPTPTNFDVCIFKVHKPVWLLLGIRRDKLDKTAINGLAWSWNGVQHRESPRFCLYTVFDNQTGEMNANVLLSWPTKCLRWSRGISRIKWKSEKWTKRRKDQDKKDESEWASTNQTLRKEEMNKVQIFFLLLLCSSRCRGSTPFSGGWYTTTQGCEEYNKTHTAQQGAFFPHRLFSVLLLLYIKSLLHLLFSLFGAEYIFALFVDWLENKQGKKSTWTIRGGTLRLIFVLKNTTIINNTCFCLFQWVECDSWGKIRRSICSCVRALEDLFFGKIYGAIFLFKKS